ncbi:MAG: aldo/keto reductase [Verrucomicrobiae bacterium]
MEYRILGKTGLKVSVIGLGGFGIGGGYLMNDQAIALRAIETAFDLGINYYDTAPFVYGDSELLLGRAHKGRRDAVILATKAENLDRVSVRECVETSLRQLGTDYLDILQFRDPTPEGLAASRFHETCVSLIEEGKLRFQAVTLGDSHQLEQGRWSISQDFPVMQLAYNLIFPEAEKEILPAAAAADIGVVSRGPLCKGFLARRLLEKPDDIAAHPNFRWFTAEEAHSLLGIQRGLDFLEIPGQRTLAQAAIQFVIRHRAVSTTIPGIETPEDACELVGALDAPPLTDEEILRARKVVGAWPAIDY